MAQADADGQQDRLTTAEKKELTELRQRNRQLEMENEILKRAAAYFAKENVPPSRGGHPTEVAATKPGAVQVIAATACPRCEASIGLTCQGRRGDRVQLHAERWKAAGAPLVGLMEQNNVTGNHRRPVRRSARGR